MPLRPTPATPAARVYARGADSSRGGRPDVGVVDPLACHASTPAELKRRLEAERAGSAMLVYRDGSGRQRIVALTARLTVGRGTRADLVLSWDDEASRVHAELEPLADAWTVADDGLSRNGTFCNGERVRGRRRLRHGDRLRFGRTVVVFQALQQRGETTTALGGDAPGVALTDTQRRVLVALCRPLADGAGATPATNQRIAAEVILGVEAVKAHLRALCRKLGVEQLPQNEKRARLAQMALQRRLVSELD